MKKYEMYDVLNHKWSCFEGTLTTLNIKGALKKQQAHPFENPLYMWLVIKYCYCQDVYFNNLNVATFVDTIFNSF